MNLYICKLNTVQTLVFVSEELQPRVFVSNWIFYDFICVKLQGYNCDYMFEIWLDLNVINYSWIS